MSCSLEGDDPAMFWLAPGPIHTSFVSELDRSSRRPVIPTSHPVQESLGQITSRWWLGLSLLSSSNGGASIARELLPEFSEGLWEGWPVFGAKYVLRYSVTHRYGLCPVSRHHEGGC